MIRFLATLALTLVTASTALAAPPAPGAPGDRHTWTAADKHGFGTATQLGSHTWFTLRSAELTEIYYPDLGTPSLRQLEFVVTDGKRFADRETGPGVRSRVEPIPGSLAFRQVTETRRWRLTKTWIGDPARDAVLGKVRFRSLTGRILRLYVLVDPAPGDDGNDDRGSRAGHGLAAWDDTVASVVAADPKLGRQTSGYAGTASDPWTDLRRDGDLDRSYEARQPGNVVQAARTRLTGTRGRDSMTLLAGRDATPHLATIARTANDGLMLPEQVWDGRPPTGRPGHEFGEGTRSATPLAWTHGQLIRLAWSIDAGEPIERPSIVACRYTDESCG